MINGKNSQTPAPPRWCSIVPARVDRYWSFNRLLFDNTKQQDAPLFIPQILISLKAYRVLNPTSTPQSRRYFPRRVSPARQSRPSAAVTSVVRCIPAFPTGPSAPITTPAASRSSKPPGYRHHGPAIQHRSPRQKIGFAARPAPFAPARPYPTSPRHSFGRGALPNRPGWPRRLHARNAGHSVAFQHTATGVSTPASWPFFKRSAIMIRACSNVTVILSSSLPHFAQGKLRGSTRGWPLPSGKTRSALCGFSSPTACVQDSSVLARRLCNAPFQGTRSQAA